MQCPYVSGGDIFRDIAEKWGATNKPFILEMDRIHDPAIDEGAFDTSPVAVDR